MLGRYLHLMDIKMNDHRSLRMPRGVRAEIVGNEVAGANLTCKWILHYIQISSRRKCVLTTISTRRGVRENYKNPGRDNATATRLIRLYPCFNCNDPRNFTVQM